MKLARCSVVLLAVSIYATAVFAQVPHLFGGSNSAPQATARKLGHNQAKPRITLRVDDLAHLDPVVLTGSKEVTTAIFRKADVETVWLDCTVNQTDCGQETERPQFRLRILASPMDKDTVSDNALGFAMPCHENDLECIFFIFYSRITDLAAIYGIGPDRILGHVMAHEIGHTLLGPDAHAVSGIMQAGLAIPDMKQGLYFTSSQPRRLRAELLARKRATNREATASF